MNAGSGTESIITYNPSCARNLGPIALDPSEHQPSMDSPFAACLHDRHLRLKDPGCKNAIFAATNREHADLQDDANDSISSFACTFDSDCKDIPA